MQIVTVYFRDFDSPAETFIGVKNASVQEGSLFIFMENETVIFPMDVVFKALVKGVRE